jgi:hypothetical protein
VVNPAVVRVDFTHESVGPLSVTDAALPDSAHQHDDPAPRRLHIQARRRAGGGDAAVDAGRLILTVMSVRIWLTPRNPAFPETPTTMRQLLSHRAGLKDEIDYIVPLSTLFLSAVLQP